MQGYDTGCAVDNKTYVINFHAYVQDGIAEILASLVSKANLITPVDPIRTSNGESSKLGEGEVISWHNNKGNKCGPI